MTTTTTTTASALLASVSLLSCTLDYDLDVAPVNTAAIAAQGPLDILFVVDNSGSMLDEHETLVRTVFDDRCPIGDLRAVPQRFANASPEMLGELAKICGLAQLLAAIDGDFHIGVITTDVGACDERLPSAQDPDGLHTPTPMRGCLQGGGVLTRDDDVLAAFQGSMLGVGTYGNPRERGFDAMKAFLDPGSRRAPGCEDDLDGFLREDGQLLVVFVADEDDCSHADGAFGFDDELAAEPAGCGEYFDLFTHSTQACTDDAEHLAPVSLYSDFLTGLRTSGQTQNVYVGVVGGLFESRGVQVPGACSPDIGGTVTAVCTPAFGTGNSCGPEESCCAADGAFRYAELAAAVNSEALLGSICAPDFRAPLLPIFFQSDLQDDASDDG
ncbi:MAG: hypothetical protein Q8O67_02510 [Deltaproteobacteria bacterium]|nr:hypothetical protein [Deltaproteobacteria bacterium]